MSPVEAPILLVESDRRLGEAMARQLAADGYRVELASNARHARVLAAGSRPRLAVLGRLDPPRGALALLEEIRAGEDEDAWDAQMPALVIGGSAGELDAVRAFESGADDFLPAPVGYLELRGFISSGEPASISSKPAASGLPVMVVLSRARLLTRKHQKISAKGSRTTRRSRRRQGPAPGVPSWCCGESRPS